MVVWRGLSEWSTTLSGKLSTNESLQTQMQIATLCRAIWLILWPRKYWCVCFSHNPHHTVLDRGGKERWPTKQTLSQSIFCCSPVVITFDKSLKEQDIKRLFFFSEWSLSSVSRVKRLLRCLIYVYWQCLFQSRMYDVLQPLYRSWGEDVRVDILALKAQDFDTRDKGSHPTWCLV